MRTVAALVLAVVGCGRWGFADHPAGDARAGDAVLHDDANVLALPFTNITPLAEINDPTAEEDEPCLTGDLLELYFDAARVAPGAAMGDIWVAKRASTADPFGAPTLVTELASLSDDTTPEVTLDGLTMFFSSDRLKPGDRDIYMTTRPDRASAWSAPQRVTELSSIDTDDSAEMMPDGLQLVMSRGPSMGLDLEVATRAAKTTPWNPPVTLPGLSDPAYDESQQWAAPDLTVIYFVTDKAPSQSEDIWLATRPDTQSAFTIQRITELSTGAIDVDPWLTPDLHTIYFASGRNGTTDIFTATR
jgi:Tol biopolymer transport system component